VRVKSPPVEPHCKKRHITPEEKAVWRQHTKHDEKLRAEERDCEQQTEITTNVSAPNAEPRRSIKPQNPVTTNPKTQATKSLEKSVAVDIDRRTAMRFRKGKMQIDARLDLHGHTRETAYIQLLAFIHQSYQLGRRCVLVITGRGLFQKNTPPQERGILRGALRSWLNDSAIRPFILAYDQAQIKDGGEGAFYVLLKRKRN
jgi:DNA-nicking Smr family endonuclease